MHYFLVCLLFSFIALDLHAKEEAFLTPQIAKDRLIEGNKRYVSDRLLHPRRDQDRRESLESIQKPFATILGCSDSRVSPEIIFDQGIGDLFVVRVAGNVPGQIVLESIEYSAEALNSSIILVLGHENCGAVKAVLDHQIKDIQAIADYIQPSVNAKQNSTDNPLKQTIIQNVKHTVEKVKQRPIIQNLITKNRIDVIGGYYNLSTGVVDLIN